MLQEVIVLRVQQWCNDVAVNAKLRERGSKTNGGQFG
jgi:hypothetical protein